MASVRLWLEKQIYALISEQLAPWIVTATRKSFPLLLENVTLCCSRLDETLETKQMKMIIKDIPRGGKTDMGVFINQLGD